MNIEFLCCPICYEQYDQARHLPRIIRQCGHTVCSACLGMILGNRQQARCPLDYKEFSFLDSRLESFPVNFSLSQLCDIQSKKGVCDSHNEQMGFVCLTDGFKICEECVGDTNHKGHDIKSIKTITKDVNSKRKDIKTLLDTLDASHKDLERTLKSQKDLILNTIKTEFDNVRNLLYVKEHNLIFEVLSVFDTENKKISSMTGIESFLRTTLSRKVHGLDDFLKQQDFFNYEGFLEQTQKFINECNLKIMSDVISQESIKIKEELQEKCKTISQYIMEHSTALSNFDFLFESSFSDNLVKVFSDNTQIDTFERSPLFNSHFTLNFSNTTLKISNLNFELKENHIDQIKFEQAQHVTLELKKAVIDEKDVAALSYLWKRIGEPSSLELEFSPGTINNKIIPILLRGPTTSPEITINLKGYNLNEHTNVAPFISRLLARMTNLRGLTLEFDGAKISKQDIETIFHSGMINKLGLENISFSLNKTNLRDADIRNIFVELPNLKSVILNLCGTSITNQTVDTFSKETLHSAKSLEKLVFWTDQSQVNDHGFQNMFLNLDNLKMLCLGLMSTGITDKTVDAISQAMTRSSETLEDFRLITSSAQVTDQGICQIFKSLPNVKFFGMDLSGANITDKSLTAFAQETLTSMKGLEDLTIILNKTRITDVGLQELFKNLPVLKSFQGGFISTRVTDKAIEFLMEEKLPLLLSLTELQMDLSNTFVSSVLQTQVQDLSKSIASRKEF